MNPEILPGDQMLRMPAVRQLVPLSPQRIYRLIAEGRFPAPERIGLAAVAWKRSSIDSYLRERAAAGTRISPHSTLPSRESATA